MYQHGTTRSSDISLPQVGYTISVQQPKVKTDMQLNQMLSAHVLAQSSSTNWQFQQFAVQPQFKTSHQQQWLVAQHKAAEEQRKLYEQMMKQRQFDEQKEKLKATGIKTGESFPSTHGAPASCYAPNYPGVVPGSKDKERDSVSGRTSDIQLHTLSTAGYTCSQDSTNLEPQACLSHLTVTGTGCVPQSVPSSVSSVSASEEGHLHPPSGSASTAKPPFIPCRAPLMLPLWILDKSVLPEIYQSACDLVGSSEPLWMDTVRVSLLLMRTNIPPHVLAVLWEMVNCTSPGILTREEFCALLALVALVQKGQPFTGPEILSTLREPVLPFIDHPALLPSLPKSGAVHASDPMPDVLSQPNSHGAVHNQQPKPVYDDDFADFVSAPSGCCAGNTNIPPDADLTLRESGLTIEASPSSSSTSYTCLVALSSSSVMSASYQPQYNPDDTKTPPKLSSVCSVKVMNFPVVGMSPQKATVASRDSETLEEEFCDFQSAPASHTSCSASKTDSLFFPPETSAAGPLLDKYAAFREMEDSGAFSEPLASENVKEDFDEPFGEFCSGVTLLADAGTAGVLDSTSRLETRGQVFVQEHGHIQPPFVSLARNLYEGDTSDHDLFGDFEDASKSGADVLPDLVQRAVDSEAEFGSFAAPDVTADGLCVPQSLVAETQSVASLELPGLDVTVGLAVPDGPGNKETSSPDLFCQIQCDPLSAVETSLEQLSLNVTTPSFATACTAPSISATSSSHVGPVLHPLDYCHGVSLSDKYSLVRDQVEKVEFEDPHMRHWKQCLEGSLGLLKEAMVILEKLESKPSLLEQVLSTSQMMDYLTDLCEVWKVIQRIKESSQTVSASDEVGMLLLCGEDLWKRIECLSSKALKDEMIISCNKDDTQPMDKECSICLLAGGASLSYGGYFYHPSCANLWLNVVDLTLPSLTRSSATLL